MYTRRSLLATSALLALAGIAGASPDCEWCGAHEAPEDLASTLTIAGADEPGERLILSGTVYGPDGQTPASGVLLYLYHTNAEGIYPRRGDETGNGRRHGYLRGWLRTGEDGRYQVHTIRPAQYPTRRAAAHIHVTVTEPGKPEYWIESVNFAGDPLLEDDEKDSPGVIELHRRQDGTWIGHRDIVLKP